jgi:hypothetical protein
LGRERLREALMPWKRRETMEQRIEFVLRALRTENFRALCQEYGISAKTGYKAALFSFFLCFICEEFATSPRIRSVLSKNSGQQEVHFVRGESSH